jgi:Protein kinase domain
MRMPDLYGGVDHLAPGTRLNDMFEIDRRIASGGMGEIYQGHAIETGLPVAVKVMRTDLVNNETAFALLSKEASALSQIQHDAVVRCFIFSSDPRIRRHYLAMEFVDGEPLSELIKRGPLAYDDVRLLQRRIASGLDAAHRHGIIHRDVSPDNIIVPDSDVGRAKIIDFGIACSTRAGARTIGFAGKYNYVSPEQLGLFGGDVTAKSDIYSLGIVLAQCLSGGSIDMGGSSEFEVVEKYRVVPNLAAVDARLRPLLTRMLEPDPKDRPESMAKVAAWEPDSHTRRATTPQPAAARQLSAEHLAQMPAQDGTQGPAKAPIRRKSVAGERFELVMLVLVALLSTAGIVYYVTGEPIPPWGSQPAKPRPDTVAADRQRRDNESTLLREAEERLRLQTAQAERERVEHEAALRLEREERLRREAAEAAEAARQRLEREVAATRETEERTRQEAAAETERQRVDREAAAKREAEEKARQEAVAAAEAAERQNQARVTLDPLPTILQPSPVPQGQVCKLDEERLARLRASQARDEVIRFERELGCERLRPQLLRLRESLFAEGERDERDVSSQPRAQPQSQKADARPQTLEHEAAANLAPPSISQDQVCKRDAETLTRLRVSQARDEVIRFERELGCERLRPQVVRLRESIGAN